MIALKDSYAEPIERDILSLLYDEFYAPLFDLAQIKPAKFNAAESALIAALRAGKVRYESGVFTGEFSARISSELSAFARYDKRSGLWRGNPSPAVKAASIMAETRRRELQAELTKAIDAAEARIGQAIEALQFGDDLPLFQMATDIKADLYSVGVMPEIDARTEKTLRREYTANQQRNVKNWAPEQVERLREMVRKYQTTGTNESLRDLIMSEYDTTAKKARFLATQETRLFLDTLSRDRAKRTGVRRYRWSTSKDERVRDDHKLLDGAIVDLDSPGPIVDRRTGRRAHAGQDFGCRCAKIWLLD